MIAKKPDSAARRTWRIIALVILFGLPAIGMAAFALKLVGRERHGGCFAPVRDGAGKGVHFLQRDTTGLVRGMGQEFFTASANARVLTDDFSLRYLDMASGQVEVLQCWSGSPWPVGQSGSCTGGPDHRAREGALFFEQLRALSQMSGIHSGDESGNPIFVSRSSDVRGGDFRTRIVSIADGGAACSD